MGLTDKISKIFGKETKQENLILPAFSQEQLWKLFDTHLLLFIVGDKKVELTALPIESEPGAYWRFLLNDETGRTIAELTLSESDYTWDGRLLYDKYSKEFDTIIDQLNQQKEEVKIHAKIVAEREKTREDELKALQD